MIVRTRKITENKKLSRKISSCGVGILGEWILIFLSQTFRYLSAICVVILEEYFLHFSSCANVTRFYQIFLIFIKVWLNIYLISSKDFQWPDLVLYYFALNFSNKTKFHSVLCRSASLSFRSLSLLSE